MTNVIEGYVEHIIFRNEDNGYTVLNLTVDGEEVTCVGLFQYINEGEMIEAAGSYISHAVYGEQFKIESYETKIPEDTVAMERYLGSGAIKGVGAALAARIVRRFGEDTLRIVDEEPERLAEVKGISEKKAREIAIQAAEKSEMRKAMIFLQQYGISVSLCAKIYSHYQAGVYGILKENPYRLAEDVQGVGFKTADEIAGRMGIVADSKHRICSGLLYVLVQATSEGHCYLPKGQLLNRAAELLGVDVEHIEEHISDLAITRKIIQKELPGEINPITLERENITAIYANSFYYLELNTARMLQDLDVSIEENEKQILKRLNAIEKAEGILLADQQKQAVVESIKNGVLVLTGGPGTGKTTTINAMIHYFEAEGLDIFLAAPTGRAAKRMTEATGYEASTIHRLLELTGIASDSSSNIRFERNEENPLEADVIIIDEMSMVDINLMHALLSAIPIGARLILVGDMNQLPSVGPGSVLKDIIRSKTFCVVELEEIFRQAEESDIVVNAHRINAGQEVAIDNDSADFFFLKRYEADIIIRVMIALIQEKLPSYVDAKPLEIQVLTPMRKGVLGVERLNVILQQHLNPPASSKREREHTNGLFREGDKVMQIKNNYQIGWEVRGQHDIVTSEGVGVFNGDMGIVSQINTFAESLTVEFDEGRFVEYSFKDLDELELAYAVTIHKSQGSEYPAVILPLLSGPKMLMTRNLLYTAVTRARRCVTVVGNEYTFAEMIHNETEQRRYTTLDIRIEELREGK